MSLILGVVLFALGIILTVAIHEWGHLTAARWCGMRVRRYFVGFGPTVFSFRRPERITSRRADSTRYTEYGLKAIPFGGFCDIAGMTAQDEIDPSDEPFSMVKRPWWQRIFVLFGGILMNLLLGIVIIYGVAVTWGLPNTDLDVRAHIASTSCVPATAEAAQASSGSSSDAPRQPQCDGEGPAAEAGIRPGDTITHLNGTEIAAFGQLAAQVRKIGADAADDVADPVVTVTVDRNGHSQDFEVPVQRVTRQMRNGQTVTVGAIGISWKRPDNLTQHYGPLTAIPGAIDFSATTIKESTVRLVQLPLMVPGVVESIGGAERDANSPVSVVGASYAGGQLVEHDQWSSFFMLLAMLNFFLALFNLVPLPPLDGGHIAVVVYEKLRDALRRLRGKQPGGPADYRKLMPLTLVVFALLTAFGALVIVADVVNPIRLFG